MTEQHNEQAVGPCPCCGAYTESTLSMISPLFAVCDVLVHRALEVAGKRIVRQDRSRFRTLGTRPWHVAHTIWRPSPSDVDKSLRNAWDVIPALLDTHGCCGVTAVQVTEMLDAYSNDLLVSGTAHDLEHLSFRFERDLDLYILPVSVTARSS